jgi:hypothetical protein
MNNRITSLLAWNDEGRGRTLLSREVANDPLARWRDLVLAVLVGAPAGARIGHLRSDAAS